MVRALPALPKLGTLPPAEADLQALLARFEAAVAAGAPCSFATLRGQWQAMRFSFVFETRLLETPHEEFVQSLFASALDCLEVPLRVTADSPPTPAPAGAAAAASPPPAPPASANGRPAVPAGPSAAPSAAPSAGLSAGGAHSEANGPLGSLSLAELVASDDEADEQQQAALAQSLALPGSPAPRPRERQPELTDLELLSGLPELLGSLPGADEAEPSRGEPRARTAGAAEGEDGLSDAPGSPLPEPSQPPGPDPAVVRIGSIFALYALYKAQPPCQLVRIYLPLHLLRGLTWMARQSPEADAALRRLVRENAFVVGAVRRPISGTREAQQAGRSTKTALAVDHTEQRRQKRQALVQLKTSVASWSSLQHVQLLCNSYRATQERMWGSAAPSVPGLFDLQTGAELGRLVADMQKRIGQLLPYHNRSMYLASEAQMKAAEERAARQQEAGAAAQREEQAKALAAAAARRQQRADEAAELEAAVGRRRQRWAAEVDEQDDDMPTLLDLGVGAPDGSEVEGAAADPADLVLPRAARLVEQRRAAEAAEVRERLAGWRRAFQGLVPRDEPREPAATAAAAPAAEPRERQPRAPNGREREGGAASVSAMATSAGSWSPPRDASAADGGGGSESVGGGRRPKRQRVAEPSQQSAAPSPLRGRTAGEQPPQAQRSACQPAEQPAGQPPASPSEPVLVPLDTDGQQAGGGDAERALQGLSDVHAEIDRLLAECG